MFTEKVVWDVFTGGIIEFFWPKVPKTKYPVYASDIEVLRLNTLSRILRNYGG